MKTCTKCGNTKEHKEFYKDKRAKDGYYSHCKPCHNSLSTSYYNRNKSKVLNDCRAWAKANADKKNRSWAKYKATKLAATPGWFETELVDNVYKKAHEFGFEVDHIVPLKSDLVCGLHCWANLQLLSPELNRSKSNRDWPDSPNS